MKKIYSTQLRLLKKQLVNLVLILVILAGTLTPMLMTSTASAASLTSRSMSISSGVPSQTGVSYTFGFTIGAATTKIQSLKFQACTVAVGTCGTVSGLTFASAVQTGQSGFQGATAFAADAVGAGDCVASATILCAKRTDATAQTTVSAKTITFSTITNPSAANTAFFVRITTYSAITTQYNTADIIDTGTTASAVGPTVSLTVSAAVAEVLNFCVGATTVNDGTTSPGTDCTAVTGTAVNLGTLDTGHVNTSPVATNCSATGCSDNGVAMLRTNALNGTTISYDAILAGSGSSHLGALRQTGAACGGSGGASGGLNPATNVNTDACINSIGSTHATVAAGTENFGMTIGAVNCGSTTSYTCVYLGGSNNPNLVRAANYNGDGTNDAIGYTTDTDQTTGTTHDSYAWDETGTVVQIASSSTDVDDEALILKFAATPTITTPFGAYSVQSDYIAVPTY